MEGTRCVLHMHMRHMVYAQYTIHSCSWLYVHTHTHTHTHSQTPTVSEQSPAVTWASPAPWATPLLRSDPWSIVHVFATRHMTAQPHTPQSSTVAEQPTGKTPPVAKASQCGDVVEEQLVTPGGDGKHHSTLPTESVVVDADDDAEHRTQAFKVCLSCLWVFVAVDTPHSPHQPLKSTSHSIHNLRLKYSDCMTLPVLPRPKQMPKHLLPMVSCCDWLPCWMVICMPWMYSRCSSNRYAWRWNGGMLEPGFQIYTFVLFTCTWIPCTHTHTVYIHVPSTQAASLQELGQQLQAQLRADSTQQLHTLGTLLLQAIDTLATMRAPQQQPPMTTPVGVQATPMYTASPPHSADQYSASFASIVSTAAHDGARSPLGSPLEGGGSEDAQSVAESAVEDAHEEVDESMEAESVHSALQDDGASVCVAYMLCFDTIQHDLTHVHYTPPPHTT